MIFVSLSCTLLCMTLICYNLLNNKNNNNHFRRQRRPEKFNGQCARAKYYTNITLLLTELGIRTIIIHNNILNVMCTSIFFNKNKCIHIVISLKSFLKYFL